MGVETNGRPRESSKEPPGPARLNGHLIPRRPPHASKHTSSWTLSSFSILARCVSYCVAPYNRRGLVNASCCRLSVWYLIITALFRCPSSLVELKQDSPQVCKPYLTARSHVDPYVKPYYDTYAVPYVDKARPYIQKVDHYIYTPSMKWSKQSYEAYGAPRVDQARQYGQARWENTIKPQMEAVQAHAKKQYDSTLAPQVGKIYTATIPYIIASRDRVSETYTSHVLPAYLVSRPYVERTYATVQKVAFDTGLPYAKSAWASTAAFTNRTVWPKLRILYGENVEPQLMRISERLGRYRDGRKLKAAMKDIDT